MIGAQFEWWVMAHWLFSLLGHRSIVVAGAEPYVNDQDSQQEQLRLLMVIGIKRHNLVLIIYTKVH